jgi:hypothetical protein
MDIGSINLILKDIIMSLSHPLIPINEVFEILTFVNKDFITIFKDDKKTIEGINYCYNILSEICVYDERYKNFKNDLYDERLHDIVLIVDNNLCINDLNKDYLQGDSTIVKCLIKTVIHLLWQRLYEIFNNSPLTENDLEEASELYKSTVGDIISTVKKCDMVNI